MRPIIGITTDRDGGLGKVMLNQAYVDAIWQAGGMPFLIPAGVEADAERVVEKLDGLLLPGGGDIDPALFGEEPSLHLGAVAPERDSLENAVAKEMLAQDKPVLGICRGMQVLNVLLGGSLYQDLESEYGGKLIQHKQKAPRSHATHTVKIRPGSRLEKWGGAGEIRVNSFHHQAVKMVGEPFDVSAKAPDGIVEAIESAEHRFAVGVQWHPEELAGAGDRTAQAIFKAFIEACSV